MLLGCQRDAPTVRKLPVNERVHAPVALQRSRSVEKPYEHGCVLILYLRRMRSQNLLETLELTAQDLSISRLIRPAEPLEENRVAALANQERWESPVPLAGTQMRYRMGSPGQPWW